MICEKCGKETWFLNVNTFDKDGCDSDVAIPTQEYPENAVVLDATTAWTGFELSDEEMMGTISCPHCGKFPFESREIQVYHIVRLVMFKKGGPENVTDDFG